MAQRLAKFTESIVVDDAGTLKAANGATVTVYAPDTTTPLTCYSDSDGAVLIGSSEIVLGADGLVEFYVRSQDRRFDLYVTAGADPTFTAFTLADMCASFNDFTYYSSEYVSLQAAITAMTAGATLIIDQDYTLSAVTTTNKTDIVIEGINRGVTLTIDTDANCDVLDLQGTRVTLRNLTINGNSTNQAGAGPYYGIDCSAGCTDCLIEDVLVTNVKGSGVRCTYATDTTFRRVRSHANTVHGWFHDASATEAARVTFDDCQGTSSTNNDGFHFEPPFSDCTMKGCLAKDNTAGSGFSFVGTATTATKTRIILDSCHAIGNGTGATGSGLSFDSGSNAGTTISGFQVNGGHFTGNGINGISLTAEENSTNPGTDSIIRNFNIVGTTTSDNEYWGLYVSGRIGHGNVIGHISWNDALTGGQPIALTTVVAANALADGADAKRAKWIKLISPHVFVDSSSAATYGIHLGVGTKFCSVLDATIVDGGAALTGRILDEGKQNMIRQEATASSAGYGVGGGGGFFAFPLETDALTPSGESTFWLTGRADAEGTTHKVFSNRITANTRVLAICPMDITAAAVLMSGGGWYHDLASNASGTATAAGTASKGNLSIKTQVACGEYSVSGEFQVLCAEAQT